MNHHEIPEDWEEKSLGSLARRIVSGSTPSTSNPRFWNGEIIWVTPEDLSENDSMYLSSSSRRITPKGLNNSSAQLIPKRSIVMSSRAPIGYVAIMDLEYATNQGCKSIELRDASPEFVYYSLVHNMPKIKQQGEGTTFAEISKSQLERVSLALPKSTIEQGNIANVLQTIDKTIEKTKHLIRKYKKVKQGLMQEFFDEVRRNEDSGWIKITLGHPEYFELATGGTPSTIVPEYWGGTIRWMASGDVHRKKIFDVDGRITDKGYENSNATLIPRDSVLIALAGQGKTRGTVAINRVELTTNQSVAAIIPNKGKIHPQYLYHYLDNKYLELRSISAGAGRAGLSLAILGKYEITLPQKLTEQERVAQVLDRTDETIQSEESYQDKLIKAKTGLMQDLLTGRVRVAT
jgi:type I restriction enzyme S subunit